MLEVEKNARDFSIKETVRRNDGRVKMNTHSIMMYKVAMPMVISTRLTGEQVSALIDEKKDCVLQRRDIMMNDQVCVSNLCYCTIKTKACNSDTSIVGCVTLANYTPAALLF